MERYAPTLKDLALARRRLALHGPGDQGRPRLRSEQGLRAARASTHLGAETIMKRLPGDPRDRASSSPTSTSIKEPIPVVPTIHYQMGGIPTNYPRPGGGAEGRQPERGGQRPVRGRRVRLRQRCTAPTAWAPTRCSTCWCSAAPPATTSSRTCRPSQGAQAAAGRRRRRARWRAWRGWTASTGGEYAQDVGQRHPQRTMQAHCRRVPHPGSCWTRA
ncbi:MAG: hypothetical protein MZW92_73735 [Comamonadaceae bacterium]|nr:hypothetical protein [Comamonadaceae bacterium]